MNGGQGFKMQSDERGKDWIHEDMVQCAAEEPMIQDSKGKVAFDPDLFERRLLSICETKGRA